MAKRNKTSQELNDEILAMKEGIKKLKREQRIAEKMERAEQEKLERQRQIEEALRLMEIAKNTTLTSNGKVITVYDYLKTFEDNPK